MKVIEEKTPKGFVLKINVQRSTFLAFDRYGSTVFADEDQVNTVHEYPYICFLGRAFNLSQRVLGDYTLLKVSRSNLLLPYYLTGQKDLHYHLLETAERIDMVPVKLNAVRTVIDFIELVEEGVKPHYIFVESTIADTDLVILRNRYNKGTVVTIDVTSKQLVTKNKENKEDEKDYHINLNMMSTNPVFLASIHLKDFKLANVKQLLFDFDLTLDDTMFIQEYIQQMLKDESLRRDERSRGHLLELDDNFNFYNAVISRDEETIRNMVGELNDTSLFSSYRTILAKVKSLESSGTQDELDLVDYENMLYERKEEIESK